MWRLTLAFAAGLGLLAQDKSVKPVQVGRRVALVLGNSQYQRLSPIPAASADADDIAAALRGMGFQVIIRKDAGLREMTSALSEFRAGIHSGDLALFYYSGHGGQAGDSNYLLPIDFEPVDNESILPRVAYPMAEIRDLMESAGARVRLLVFDACRTSSLVNGKGSFMGLREMGGKPEGTLVAYASAHGQIARFESGARNSLYTSELLGVLRGQGHLKELLEATQRRVYEQTGGKQTPYLYGFLSGNLFLRESNNPPTAAPALPAAPPREVSTGLSATRIQPELPIALDELAANPSPKYKDQAEYDLLNEVNKAAADPSRQMALLDTWAVRYPASELRTHGLGTRLNAAQKLGLTEDMWQSASELFAISPRLAAYYVAALAPSRTDTSPGTLALAHKAALGALAQPIQGAAKAIMRSTLGWVAVNQGRFDAAEAEYSACVSADHSLANCSYRLGEAILRQKNANTQSAALYHIVRASVLDGPGALPAANRRQVEDYVKRTYATYHGSLDGFDQVAAAARTQPFPTAGFRIESTVEIEDRIQEEQAKLNPQLKTWRDIRTALTGPSGQSYFDNDLKGALIPWFTGTVVEVKPLANRRMLAVKVDVSVEAHLFTTNTLAHAALKPGTQIEFQGVVTGFQPDPYRVEIDVERDGIRVKGQ